MILLVAILSVVVTQQQLSAIQAADPILPRATKLTKCLNLQTVGSPYVQSNFQEEKMQGFWYELAVKKLTQPRFCQCQTSNKTINADSNNSITDEYYANCAGLDFRGKLNYQFSDTPGIWTVNFAMPNISNIKFPNAAVDVGVNTNTGEYDWMIEFSCKELKGEKIFYAINMYSRTYNNSKEIIPLMVTAARRYGLGPYIDQGRTLHYPDHTNCMQHQ
jgi:hypothetical protein